VITSSNLRIRHAQLPQASSRASQGFHQTADPAEHVRAPAGPPFRRRRRAALDGFARAQVFQVLLCRGFAQSLVVHHQCAEKIWYGLMGRLPEFAKVLLAAFLANRRGSQDLDLGL